MRYLISVLFIIALTLCGCGKYYYTEADSLSGVGEKIYIRTRSHSRIMDEAFDCARKHGHCFVMTYRAPAYHDAPDSAMIWYYDVTKHYDDRINVNYVSKNNPDVVRSYPTQRNRWIGLFTLSNDMKSHCYRVSSYEHPLYVCQLMRVDKKIILLNLPMHKADTIYGTSEFPDSLESHIKKYCFPDIHDGKITMEL